MINTGTLRKAWSLLHKPERRGAGILVIVVIFAALSSALMVGSVMPFLSVLSDPSQIQSTPVLRIFYDWGGFSSDYTFLVALGITTCLVIFVTSLIQISRVWVISRFSTNLAHVISCRLLGVYLKQPYEYFLNRHTGDMATQILSEANTAVTSFFSPLSEIIASLLTMAAILTLLIWINPTIALAMIVTVGVIYGLIYIIIRKKVMQFGQIRAAANKRRYRLANEALSGVKIVKILNQEHAYFARYATPSATMARADFLARFISGSPQYIMQALAFGGLVIVCTLLMTPEMVESGNSLGSLLPTLAILALAAQRLLPELSNIYRGVTQLSYGAAAVETIYNDLDGQDTMPPNVDPNGKPVGLTQHLRLDGLSYRYPNSERMGLDAISLTINTGERVGIIGTTGAGKTTLADIIMGLLAPSAGTLVVDGTPITPETMKAWRHSIGYVPQEIYLTDNSIAENIAFGISPDAIDHDRVKKAATIAQIDHFVETDLPQGYGTAIGERGVRLSGGQRQRIGIARALYNDADLIVFDEATSALDNVTEREVMGAIDAIPGDKTILLVAHRLSTVQSCDKIIVLDQGKIVGLGSWEDLHRENNAAFQKITLQSDT